VSPPRPFLVLTICVAAAVSGGCRREAPPPIPAGAFGDAVRRGRALLVATRDSLPAHVGNQLRCVSCHLDEGRRETGSWVAYLAFLSHGTPVGPPPSGARLQQWAAFKADTAVGARVFATTCAQCHGADGAGTPAAPPVWGPASYNIGAGMARVRTAAEFIRRNMPFDKAGTLTDQQAFDVAAYVNAQSRPDYAGKEGDWPKGDPPPDVAYPTRAQQQKPIPR